MSQVLFTINIWNYSCWTGETCEIVEIYGPTREKLESSRPVNSSVGGRLGRSVMNERNERIEHLDRMGSREKEGHPRNQLEATCFERTSTREEEDARSG